MEKRMYVPWYLQVCEEIQVILAELLDQEKEDPKRIFEQEIVKGEIDLRHHPEPRKVVWIEEKQFAKDGIICIGRGSVGAVSYPS